MKTITIYELLGMIKDGKELPEKIRVHNTEYHKCLLNAGVDYKIYSDDFYYLSNDICKAGFSLNDEVEILEEEKKIPEKLFFTHISNYNDQSVINNNFNDYFKKTKETINQLIDYLKSKGE